jgi:hypothetical protein
MQRFQFFTTPIEIQFRREFRRYVLACNLDPMIETKWQISEVFGAVDDATAPLRLSRKLEPSQ